MSEAYRIVQNTNPEKLAEEVTGFMAYGWRCYGSLVVVPYDPMDLSGDTYLYIQAMVL